MLEIKSCISAKVLPLVSGIKKNTNRHKIRLLTLKIQYVIEGPMAVATWGKNLTVKKPIKLDTSKEADKPIPLDLSSKSSESTTQMRAPTPAKENDFKCWLHLGIYFNDNIDGILRFDVP